jgi:hypothetical protein
VFFAIHEERSAFEAGWNSCVAQVIYRVSPFDVHDNLRIAKVVQAEDLPEQFLRIHRQKGVFLVVASPALINESPHLLGRFVFYQTEAGLNFNSKQLGVEKSLLLPDCN